MLDMRKPRLSEEETKILMNEFEVDPRPGKQRRMQLAAQIGTTPRRVQIWFQNARAKRLRQQRESGTQDNQTETRRDDKESVSPDSGMCGADENLSDSGETKPHPWLDNALPVDSPVLVSTSPSTILHQGEPEWDDSSSHTSSTSHSRDSTSPVQGPGPDLSPKSKQSPPSNKVAGSGINYHGLDAIYKPNADGFLFLRSPSPDPDMRRTASLQSRATQSLPKPTFTQQLVPGPSRSKHAPPPPPPLPLSAPKQGHVYHTTTSSPSYSSPPSMLPSPSPPSMLPSPSPPSTQHRQQQVQIPPQPSFGPFDHHFPSNQSTPSTTTNDASTSSNKNNPHTNRRYAFADWNDAPVSPRPVALRTSLQHEHRPSRKRFKPQYPYTRHNFPNSMPDLLPLDRYLSHLATLDPGAS
eukprot:NODE_409_length_1536_cov_79.191625_g377_i0.p1 GENE.NODE_409_length_1536_cov_79.191625_g377_i0~~NODE_409_length_1536_cov_79.191625_g377_i0.p1  ORF type:complete len:410 (+),score=40.05 NODE_409_length_1536_cov_79.191625_g377_i0:185-1414(+)